MVKSSKTPITKAAMQARIDELKQQVADLNNKSQSSFSSLVRQISVFILVIICALMLNLTTLSVWLRRNVINTDMWVSKISVLIANESVRQDIAGQITDTIFETANVEQLVSEMIPPRISALSVPLTNNLRVHTTNKTAELLASQKFQSFWQNANRSAHSGIIASLENGGKRPANTDRYIVYINNEELLLNLKPIIQQLQSDLSVAGLSFVGNLNTTSINKTVTLSRIESLPRALVVFDLINKATHIFILASIIAGTAAITLSIKKRKTLISISLITIILMVVNFQTIHLARYPAIQQVSSSIQASSTESAIVVIDILTEDLILLNRTLMTIATIVLLFCILTGNSKFAHQFRSFIRRISIPKQSNSFFKLIANNKITLVWLLTVIGVLLVSFPPIAGPAFLVICISIISLLILWTYSVPDQGV